MCAIKLKRKRYGEEIFTNFIFSFPDGYLRPVSACKLLHLMYRFYMRLANVKGKCWSVSQLMQCIHMSSFICMVVCMQHDLSTKGEAIYYVVTVACDAELLSGTAPGNKSGTANLVSECVMQYCTVKLTAGVSSFGKHAFDFRFPADYSFFNWNTNIISSTFGCCINSIR